jgi:hypothetical protein
VSGLFTLFLGEVRRKKKPLPGLCESVNKKGWREGGIKLYGVLTGNSP